MIASCEPEFPRGLAAAEPPPPIITVLGHATLLDREMVAIVGARNASALGRKFAGTLARDLAQAGLVVASGLARGIDAAAHEGALAGGTCAVVAGGVDIVYPPENGRLYERIRAQGCIVVGDAARSGAAGAPLSRAATGSSPACRAASSSWRRRKDPAR